MGKCLKKMAEMCSFKLFQKKALGGRFVFGTRRSEIVKLGDAARISISLKFREQGTVLAGPPRISNVCT